MVESLEELASKLPPERITINPVDLYMYSEDITELPGHMPDCVVLPKTVKEIQEIIKFASKYKIPIVPRVTGTNVGGLTIPLKGGIVVDLRLMNRIIEVQEGAMYAVIEPGVSFGQIKKYLDDNHPTLESSYPWSPPNTSFMANALNAGKTNHSNAHGTMAEGINGIEVVLSDASIAKIGSCSIESDLGDSNWHSRYVIPDLLGLFINWQGMTGIVTKLGIQLWPKKPIERFWLAICKDGKAVSEFTFHIGKLGLVDDITSINLEAAHMIYEMPSLKLVPGEPKYMTMIRVTAYTDEHYLAVMDIIKEKIKKIEEKIDENIIFAKLDTLLHLLGDQPKFLKEMPSLVEPLAATSGITWMGSICSPIVLYDLIEKSESILKKYPDIIPFYEMKALKSSHYGTFRIFLRFDKCSKEETEAIRKLNNELLEMALEKGAIPYKAGVNFTPSILSRTDQGWKNLYKKIRNALDPLGIFNPGRWEDE